MATVVSVSISRTGSDMASIMATRTLLRYRFLVSTKNRRRSTRSMANALTILIPWKLSWRIL